MLASYHRPNARVKLPTCHIYAYSELEGLRVFGTADARRDVLDTCTYAT